MGISLVLFDLDDTLCTYDRSGRVAELARLAGRSSAAVREAIFESGFEDDGDRGLLSAEAYLAGFSQRLGAPLSRAQWYANRAKHTTLRPEMLALVREVQRRSATAVFTQNGPLLREGFATLFPELVGAFGAENIHFSCELGALKTEPEAYRRLLAQRGEEPDATLFVDDGADYVAAAEAAGLHGHHFTGLAGLERRLHGFGLLP